MKPRLKIFVAAGFCAILATSAQAQLSSPTGTGAAPSQPGGALAPGIAPATPSPSGTTGAGSGLPSSGTTPSVTQPGIPGGSPEIARYAPLLSKAAPYVAHPAIRNKGTIGGTIAHADPAAEFPGMMLALDAEFEIANSEGRRREPANGFFRGLYETGIAPGEILVAIHVPLFGEHDRCAYHELARRRGDYPLVGCGVRATIRDGVATNGRFAFIAVGAVPQRAFAAEAAIEGQPLDETAIAAAQTALEQDLQPDDDSETTGAMRLHLAKVLLGRLLCEIALSPSKAVEAAA